MPAAAQDLIPPGPGSSAVEHLDADTEVVRYERSPRDVLRFGLFTAGAVVAAVLTKHLRDGFEGVEADLTELLEVPWEWLRLSIDLLLIVTVLVAGLVVLVVPLVTRRFRLFGYVLAANLAASVMLSAIGAWVEGLGSPSSAPGASADQLARDLSADVVTTAQMVAAFVAISPFVSRRWRRLGAWLVAAVLILRMTVVTAESTHALLALTVGASAGSLVLLVFGRPTSQPRLSAILDSLRASGLPVVSIEPAAVDARSSVPYVATLADDRRLFVKVLGANQRAADLLFRVYRAVRLKNVGDERPFSSLRRTVEHEALVTFQARDVGVRTPRLRAVAPVGRDSFMLAYDLVDGLSLDRVDAERLTPDVLRRIWEQVATMQRFRIAHRDLRLANLFLDEAEEPWLIDLGFSEIAASEALLRADIAQLLAALALAVGAERAVTSAIDVLGPEVVASSLGRLQPAALSGATRSQLKENRGLLEELRTQVERQADTPEPELEPITRFGARQVFTLVMLGGVFYFLLPQLADLPGIVGQVREADWVWFAPLVVASAATYVGATIALAGSVPSSIPPLPTAAAQVGSSFASKVAPAGLGGMALNVRFLQRQGIDPAVATSSVGLNAVAGIVGHVVLIAVFLFWAGRDAFGEISLPSPNALVVALVIVLALAAIVMLVPSSRRLVTTRLVPILLKATVGLVDVLTTPSKLVLLFGGSTLVTASYTVAFYFACRAFDLDVSFAALGAVYLLGSAVATAAPTPGGLGAAEAALVGGLIAIGVDNDAAVPSVFLFRLGTFWLPILPGWIAFSWLRRSERL